MLHYFMFCWQMPCFCQSDANKISSIIFFTFKSSKFFILSARECSPDCIICKGRQRIPLIPEESINQPREFPIENTS